MIKMENIEGIDDISGITRVPLNLQEVLIMQDGAAIAMAHLSHKTVILQLAATNLRPNFETKGWGVLTTSEPFSLSMWTDEGGLTSCGKIINDYLHR